VPPRNFVGAQGRFVPGAVAANLGGGVPAGAAGASVAPGGGSEGGYVGVSATAGSTRGGGTGGTAGGPAHRSGGRPGGGSGSGGSGSGRGGGSSPLGVLPGSCAGFKNTTGITDKTITIANAADITGPVPGLFKSVQAAVTAYVAYFNATTSICGRKLKLEPLDTGTTESGDQQAATTACGGAFAMVGSLSAFDAGGASVVADCGIPDLRTLFTEPGRAKSPVSYSAYGTAVSEINPVPFRYLKTLGDAYRSAGYVYLNGGGAVAQSQSMMAALTKLGYRFKDEIAIDVTSVPNYDGYVTHLKSDGVKYVQYTGAYQFAQKLKEAMYQQDYHPVFVMDAVAYDAGYSAAGKAVDGTYSFVPGPLFEEADRNPGLRTYMEWLQRTAGGQPTFLGTYAWCAAALFTQLAVQLGARLTRASLLAAIRQVHDYTNGGMVPPQDVAGKHTARCGSVVQLVAGKWVRRTPYPFTCADSIDTGVGD
jgi:ABC-type branched-subunit amino acid transport system substrate-binding protein